MRSFIVASMLLGLSLPAAARPHGHAKRIRGSAKPPAHAAPIAAGANVTATATASEPRSGRPTPLVLHDASYLRVDGGFHVVARDRVAAAPAAGARQHRR